MKRILVGLLSCAGLVGCAAVDPIEVAPPKFAAVHPPQAEAPRQATGSIYNGVQSENWFGRGRSFQVGDVITVELNERVRGTRTTSNTTSRQASTNIPSGLSGKLADRLGMSGLDLSKQGSGSDGKGSATQEAALTGFLAVSVVEVLPNGNLVVRGEKQVSLSEGSEVIQISGVIRPQDVSPNNIVLSQRLAHAQVAYRGSGDLAAGTRPGWGSKVLTRLWPF